jgi:anhydro-N-acetylmuramic acid kinase
MAKNNLYIGIMSGTSLDAIDAVLVNFNEPMTLIASHEHELSTALREETRSLNSVCDNELNRSQVLSKQLAREFATAANHLLKQNNINAEDISAIGSHGQTLRHSPNGENGFSLQIGCGASIAEHTGITSITDFRSRDIAAGGQGAPLVPAFHHYAFHSSEKNRAIINIGGMANISMLETNGEAYGFDTGPGNVLMDSWSISNRGEKFDRDGLWAKSAEPDAQLLTAMLSDPFFLQAPPKSTGREYFDTHWLAQFSPDKYASGVFQATLLELTAQSICDALPANTDEIYLCGGGAYNLYLKERISAISNLPTATTEKLGIAPEWIEAAAFAWLAKQAIEQQPGNSAKGTGAKGPRVLGAIYPA